MPKARPAAGDSALRAIPSVERILSASAFAAPVAEFGRERVKEALVGHLMQLRAERRAYDEAHAVDAVRDALSTSTRSTLMRVINTTGVLLLQKPRRTPEALDLWKTRRRPPQKR